MRDTPVTALAVAGPTASGKTALSLPLAARYGGEILCCDSMQIYRGMDVGTAKATKEEQTAAPHHLLDIADPTEPFSAADYGESAFSVAREVSRRGKLPIFVGGTGLYLRAALRARHQAPMTDDPAYREELAERAAREGNESVHALLACVDPESAASIHPNNLRRVIRALEIYRVTGKTKTEWDRESLATPPRIRCLILYPTFEDRELLYRRIDERVDEMFRNGLVAEVKTLWERGMLPPDSTAAQAIGYKEVLGHLRGEESEETAKEAVKLATRHYAKRQITWFSAEEGVCPIRMDEGGRMRHREEILADAFRAADSFLSP